ncbi:unannotated protein [freshwater metagenome]|uniref:Unannotated protein n=1 Tax=freshwater metagenome TaxID=449393 RepID=A0A6J6UL87_9ZZZZ
MRVKPFALPSTTKSETPLAVRAETMIIDAVWPSSTNIFVPLKVKLEPEPLACIVMPASSHLPDGSTDARVAVVSPLAMAGRYFFFAASSPDCIKVFAANTTVEKNGAQSNERPISSRTTPNSM